MSKFKAEQPGNSISNIPSRRAGSRKAGNIQYPSFNSLETEVRIKPNSISNIPSRKAGSRKAGNIQCPSFNCLEAGVRMGQGTGMNN